jgi:hypothetical protein
MASKWKAGILTATLVVSTMPNVSAAPRHGGWDNVPGNRHVLLISIDGMHAVDYKVCLEAGTCPNLAELGETGINYTRTTTSRPSDSFPGLMALVSGGTPRTVGAFYDVAYDRVLAPPAKATGNGLPAGKCIAGQINGTQTEYEEGVDIDQTQLNGGFAGYSTLDGGTKSIDPDKLERDPFNGCKPVYPWNFVRTNTIYGVIHAAGGFTAWSDKHAVYASVSGPTGTDKPSNVDDYYSPEVNSNQISLPGVITAAQSGQKGIDCSTIAPSTKDWTTDFDAIKCYDQLKVNAVLNWIHGKSHLGGSNAPVPVIFGMNFQAVSVGQKLIKPASADRTDANSGGYEDAEGTPRPKMLGEIQFVDAAIGQMIAALKSEGLLHHTTIIITAKHGQSPIDPNRFFPIPGSTNSNGTPPSGIIGALLPPVFSDPNNALGIAEDDISQLWLTDPKTTGDAVTALEKAGTTIGLGQILFGDSLSTIFNPPGVPNDPGPCCFKREGGDPRTPDIVVLPNVGVVYTGGLKKQSEHGGFAWDDTNVMLLVSNPSIERRTIHSFVETTQVAPTILQILGLHPDALDAVKREGTPVLPGFDH